MKDIVVINRNAERMALGGAKVPHWVSNPVLRCYEGEYSICYFVYTYTREQRDSHVFPRPVEWLVLDVREGELIARNSCAERDFSSEPLGKTYSLDQAGCLSPDEGYLSLLETLFETTRASIVFGDTPDAKSYEAYLSKMLAITPSDLRTFYRELSDLS